MNEVFPLKRVCDQGLQTVRVDSRDRTPRQANPQVPEQVDPHGGEYVVYDAKYQTAGQPTYQIELPKAEGQDADSISRGGRQHDNHGKREWLFGPA